MFPTDMSTMYGVVQPGTSRYCPRDVCGSRLYWKVSLSLQSRLCLAEAHVVAKGWSEHAEPVYKPVGQDDLCTGLLKALHSHTVQMLDLGALQIAGQMKVSADMHWMYIHTM